MTHHLALLGEKQTNIKRQQQRAVDDLAEPWNQPSHYADAGSAEHFNGGVGHSGDSYGHGVAADDYSNPYGTGEERAEGRSKLVLKRKHDSSATSESAGTDGNGRPRLTLSRPGSELSYDRGE